MTDNDKNRIEQGRRNVSGGEYTFGQKAWLVFKNNFSKAVHLKSCCGNLGQPGC